MKKKIAVIGVGTAGVISICHLLCYLSNEYEITSIHNPGKRIIGVGESTQNTFTNLLSRSLNFDSINDLHELDATYKVATVFKKWRDDDIVVPFFGGLGLAFHFNNFKLQGFAFKRLREIYKDRFATLEADCTDVYTKENYAVAVCDGKEVQFDYVIDCRGFPDDLSDYTVSDLPLNRAIVHNKAGGANWMYTGHLATEHGWMFEIPLSDRQSYGYVFNDKITTMDDAKAGFSKTIDVPIDQLSVAEFNFKSYYANKMIEGKVIKNGNRLMFFEPMTANSIWAYDLNIRSAWDYITGIADAQQCNISFADRAVRLEEQLAYFYYGGTTYKSKFWNQCQEIAKNKLDNSKNYKDLIMSYKKNIEMGISPNTHPDSYPKLALNAIHLICLDKQLGYNHI